jgi:hypothetical protein
MALTIDETAALPSRAAWGSSGPRLRKTDGMTPFASYRLETIGAHPASACSDRPVADVALPAAQVRQMTPAVQDDRTAALDAAACGWRFRPVRPDRRGRSY